MREVCEREKGKGGLQEDPDFSCKKKIKTKKSNKNLELGWVI